MNSNYLSAAKVGVTAIFAALTAFWGWFGWLVVAWVLLMLADWLVGSLAAVKAGNWKSSKLREGVWHKGGEIIIVIVALVADWLIGLIIAQIPAVHLPFTYTVLLGPLVIVWYIIGELGSLAEHGVTFGAPVPPWLIKFLAVGKSAVDAAGNKLTDGTTTAESVVKAAEIGTGTENSVKEPAESGTEEADTK